MTAFRAATSPVIDTTVVSPSAIANVVPGSSAKTSASLTEMRASLDCAGDPFCSASNVIV